MKYIIMFIIALMHLPVWEQPGIFPNRKQVIEQCLETVYTVKELRQIADSIHLTIDELCDYPVIFPIRKPCRVSSGFGMRYHPVYKRRKFHTGIDISESKGTPVFATGNGVVTRKGYCSGYGNFIEIEHAGGFRSFYAHLSRTVVNRGDTVSITQQIACVGNTGVTTGNHLHYEIRKGKRFLNPVGWCSYLSEILNNNNKQNQYEFSKISIPTRRGNYLPGTDTLVSFCRTAVPVGGGGHSLGRKRTDNEMARNYGAVSWFGIAGAKDIRKGRFAVCRN
ncbi:M23 family metallopeptidase [Parabacteroides faecis]|uniref:M23ase beta-sheet core domain-containing protein n=1 Tax=Parabacteroides faecis TaxID=1217282 RepID=A0ABR6KSL2_9BACT|nr:MULTISPECIES: M23 family metallopeptidase [Parabacteroides]MBB4623804.1 hypothetical protein [Parabacteroides faecis]